MDASQLLPVVGFYRFRALGFGGFGAEAMNPGLDRGHTELPLAKRYSSSQLEGTTLSIPCLLVKEVNDLRSPKRNFTGSSGWSTKA